MNLKDLCGMNLKDLVGVIKDIVTTVAIIGGGAWTVYTFSALGARARVQAELFKQAVLEISIEAKQESLDLSADRGLPVSAVATVVNKGTRNTFLDFRIRPPFRISRIDFGSNGVGSRVPIMELDVRWKYWTVSVGESGRFPVFFAVPGPGLYVIEFLVGLSEDEMGIHEAVAHDAARDRKMRIVWSGNTHLVVH